MEGGSRACRKCRQKTLTRDGESGKTVCTSCGNVNEFEDFQDQLFNIDGPTGTNVYVGSSGSGHEHSYKEKKVWEAKRVIQEFTDELKLSEATHQAVSKMVIEITDGEYGRGAWFPIFVGACIYVEMRKKDSKTQLPMVRVAGLVGCDVHELGRMISRVVDFISPKSPEPESPDLEFLHPESPDPKLPAFDIVKAFKAAIENSPSFKEVSADILKEMSEQGYFMIQCLIKWCLTTGRRPIPVVVAVLVFVAELNDFPVKIEELAMELNVAVNTCRKRSKELKETLVKIAAKVLPWGKDVTVKNIMKNATFVIQYMEMKAMKKNNGEKKDSGLELVSCDIDELVGNCLSNKGSACSFDDFPLEDCESQYFDVGSSSNLIEDCSDKFQISAESLANLYANYMEDIYSLKASGNFGNNKRKRKMYNFEEYRDWWMGKSDLSKKLKLDQIQKKDVGWDGAPPSYIKGLEVKEERRERIKAAKLRIQKIMQPMNNESGLDICVFDSEKPKKSNKRRKIKAEIDSEDLIIETLLLHNVKEDEILKGYYKALLDLHVFNDPGI